MKKVPFIEIPQDPSKDVVWTNPNAIQVGGVSPGRKEDLEYSANITWIELMTNFGNATWRLFGAKTKVAPKHVVEERRKMCDTCHFWDGAARLGLGRCSHQKCGCTKFKLVIASERCPIGNWEVYANND